MGPGKSQTSHPRGCVSVGASFEARQFSLEFPNQAAVGDAVAVPACSGGSTGVVAPAEEMITIPRSSLLIISDHVNRIEQAARHCAHMSQQAANAFTEEANVLNNARVELAGLLLRWPSS